MSAGKITTRDRVIAMLRAAANAAAGSGEESISGFLSGEAISRELGISRAAVNQAVRALREEGYGIDSVTNRGYRLREGEHLQDPGPDTAALGSGETNCEPDWKTADPLTAGEILAYLGEERMRRVQCFEEIDSTNSELIRQATDGAPDRTVLVADMQKGGRGRRGRSFSSPAGMGIYLSYLVRPSTALKEEIAAMTGNDLLWASLTSWSAVAAARAVAKCCGAWPDIKWVNDLYRNGRKLCGILTQIQMESETYEVESIVIGMGINVHQRYEDFPEEIREIAGSLRTEYAGAEDAPGIHVRRGALAAELIRSLDEMYDAWPKAQAEYLAAYREHSLVLGREVVLSDSRQQPENAFVLGIEDDFALHVRMENGEERRIISGDVSLRLRRS